MTISYAYSRPETQAAELASAETLRLMLDHSPDVLVLAGADASCQHASPASAWVLGRTPTELIGTDLRDLAVEADRPALSDLFRRLSTGELSATAEFRVQHAGQPGWMWALARRLPAGQGAVLCLRDITLRKEGEAVMEEANSLLRHRAATDTVTGLLNRDHLVATLERELRRAQRERTDLAVLAVSLTEFRLFTDLYGWEAADEALRAASQAIAAALHRPADIAGRLDGDEFAILLPSTQADGAGLIAGRIVSGVAALAIPHAGTRAGMLNAVVGTAFVTPGCDVSGLLREAHRAMRGTGAPLVDPIAAG